MPFTVGGDWVPNKPEKKGGGAPVKVFKEKRKKGEVTVIKNLPLSDAEQQKIASQLKKRLGCGGGFKEGVIQLQGDRVNEIKGFLHELY